MIPETRQNELRRDTAAAILSIDNSLRRQTKVMVLKALYELGSISKAEYQKKLVGLLKTEEN